LSGDPITSAMALPLEIRLYGTRDPAVFRQVSLRLPGARAQAVKRIAVRRLND